MYAFSKILEAVLQPGNFLVLLLAAGIAIQWFGRQRYGLYVTSAASGLFLAILLLPLGTWLMRPIENRYSRPAWPQRVDGILVLGGGLDAEIFASRGAPSQDTTEARIVSAVELARHYPGARIVFSGGSGALLGNKVPEAQAARVVFAMLGVSGKRLILEDKSRNTWENIVFTKQQVKPRPDEVWVLATSALQLPRAIGCCSACPLDPGRVADGL